MEQPQILLVDDDTDILESSRLLLGDNYLVDTAKSVREARDKILVSEFDAILVDLNFEGHEEDGLNLIDFIVEEKPELPFVVLSSDSETKRVVEAMKRPLVDFITKDGDYEDILRIAIETALEKKRANENSHLKSFSFKTQSPVIKKLLTKVNQVLVSNSTAPILITGESGTGKEYLAKYICGMMGKKMVAANMASIPKDTAESELFGHLKGAFTGAINDKPGLIELANHGVFFLDEIGDCSPSIQSKLLRVVQEKEILPVGGTFPKSISLRFIAATHRDLNRMVKNEEFRFDLLQRLNTFVFKIPPLRERPEDIVYYTRQFIQEITGGEFYRVEPEGLEALKMHDWPGNVRELRNVIERAVVFSRRRALDKSTVLMALDKIEGDPNKLEILIGKKDTLFKEEIVEALKRAKGNKTHAAMELGVHVTTLHRWIKRFEITNAISGTVGRPRLEDLMDGGKN